MTAPSQRSRSRVLLTAGIVSLLLSTSAAVTATAGAAPDCGGVAWHTIRDGTQYCPRTHSVLADVNWVELSWSSWGGAVAIGRGYSAHDIFPHGRLSHYLTPIRIRLAAPRQCPHHLQVYSEITVSLYSHAGTRLVSRYTRSIPCSGETGGGNG